MNFSMRHFIKSGFLNAIGKMGDYWIILNAAGWFDKGVLVEDDLVEIQAAIDKHNAAPVTNSTAPDDTPSRDEESAPETST